MERRERRVLSDKRLMSMPSIRMTPLSSSRRRNNTEASVLFPAPVLPTTPTCCPAPTRSCRLRSDSGSCGAYRTDTLSNSISPLSGQFSGTSLLPPCGSVGMSSAYSISRSALTADDSMMDRLRNVHCKKELIRIEYVIAMAANEAETTPRSETAMTLATSTTTEHVRSSRSANHRLSDQNINTALEKVSARASS
jgi:hypothetical protein